MAHWVKKADHCVIDCALNPPFTSCVVMCHVFYSPRGQCLLKITRGVTSRGESMGLVFPVVLSGQVCKLQPTHSIKRWETHSENVRRNQWKQCSAHSNLASNRLRDQSEYLAQTDRTGYNVCSCEARSAWSLLKLILMIEADFTIAIVIHTKCGQSRNEYALSINMLSHTVGTRQHSFGFKLWAPGAVQRLPTWCSWVEPWHSATLTEAIYTRNYTAHKYLRIWKIPHWIIRLFWLLVSVLLKVNITSTLLRY